MEIQSLRDWQQHFEEGQKLLKTASGGLKRPAVFNNELIYQLTAMAVEKLLVGLWQYHGELPADHTIDGLVDGLLPICPLSLSLAEQVKEMGRFDDMCPLVPVNKKIPDDTEIGRILATAGQVAAFVSETTSTDRKPEMV